MAAACEQEPGLAWAVRPEVAAAVAAVVLVAAEEAAVETSGETAVGVASGQELPFA